MVTGAILAVSLSGSYWPRSFDVVLSVFGLLAALLVASVALPVVRSAVVARIVAWLSLAGGVAIVEQVTAEQGAGFRMFALIAAGFLGMKLIVRAETMASGKTPLPLPRWIGFALLWPGMNPSIVLSRQRPSPEKTRSLLARGAGNVALGVACVGIARLLWSATAPHVAGKIAATIFALVGLSLTLHFGVFHILTGAWRLAGFDCRPLFRAPLHSRALSEFWSRRWNLAFSEMTALAVYRPLARFGRGPALAASFVFSGLLHEMAISLPVRAGFGLPLLYFVLQLLAVSIERAAGWTENPPPTWKSRLWTLAWLILPLPILFHPPFLEGVVWPLLGEPSAAIE